MEKQRFASQLEQATSPDGAVNLKVLEDLVVDVYEHAERDRRSADQANGFNIDSKVIRTALSFGIAIYPQDGSDAETLMINADAALSRAKRDGRGSLRFFEAEMDKQQRERTTLQHELGSAIERNELKLFYQPLARIDGEITGFAAKSTQAA